MSSRLQRMGTIDQHLGRTLPELRDGRERISALHGFGNLRSEMQRYDGESRSQSQGETQLIKATTSRFHHLTIFQKPESNLHFTSIRSLQACRLGRRAVRFTLPPRVCKDESREVSLRYLFTSSRAVILIQMETAITHSNLDMWSGVASLRRGTPGTTSRCQKGVD